MGAGPKRETAKSRINSAFNVKASRIGKVFLLFHNIVKDDERPSSFAKMMAANLTISHHGTKDDVGWRHESKAFVDGPLKQLRSYD